MSTPTYVQHSWATYEMITRGHLNNLEEGVAANNAGVRALETWQGKVANVQTGSATLTNTLENPFNNSKKSIALGTALSNTNYDVVILSATAADGNIGEIEISDRLVNGFKMNYTGCASSVTVNYAIIGGN